MGEYCNVGRLGFTLAHDQGFKFCQGGSSVIIMKGGHDQLESRCGFYSKLGYCEGVVENLGGGKLES